MSRRRWLPALAVLTAAAVAACDSGAAPHSPATTRSARPRPSTVAVRHSSPVLTHRPWAARVINTGAFFQLAGLGGHLYGIDDHNVVVLLDRHGKIVARSARLGAAGEVSAPVLAGGRLWVETSAHRQTSLVGLDPLTLARVAALPLRTTTTALTVNPSTGRLYVGAAAGVGIVDPRTGSFAGHLAVRGPVSGLAVSPDGRTLYTASARVIGAYDLHTGRLERPASPTGGNPGGLTATRGGLWFSTGFGMSATVTFRGTAGGNRTVGAGGGGLFPLATIAGGAAWIGDNSGLTCADPNTGQRRAHVSTVRRDGTVGATVRSFAVVDHALFGIYRPAESDASYLVELRPPAACRLS